MTKWFQVRSVCSLDEVTYTTSGEHIGVEPTTDRFVAVMHNSEERVIPGNAAAVNAELPFR